MEIKKSHLIGAGFGILCIIIAAVFFREEKFFYFMLGISVFIGIIPFVITTIFEGGVERENNEMFLEFSRNLVESVRAGTPISKSIVNLKDKYYGSLTRHIKKLANQISLGIPVQEAFSIFARDTNSKMIQRAVSLISEAEKAGGNIEEILESVAKSVSEIEKLKKERQAAIYSLVVEGYIIFIVFLAIMLVMQFKIIPMTTDISSVKENIGSLSFGQVNPDDVARPLIYLLLLQGLFTGLIIGKLAEGKVKAGIKHSFAMIAMAVLIYTGAKAFISW